MGKSSREKGKRGEREFAEALRGLGVEARRGAQHRGGEGSPDVVTSLDGFHFEVKRTEKLSLWPSVEQAKRDAGQGVPVVAHRANRREWIAILRLEDFVELALKASR